MLGALAFALGAHAESVRRGPLDHLLCCGRVSGTLHATGDFTTDQPLKVLPGVEFGADSAVNRPVRRAPAAVQSTPPATPGIAPAAPGAGPPEPSLADLDRPLEIISGYSKISYSQLAGFKFRPPPQPIAAARPPPDVLAQVPAAIRRLDGKKIVLSGYMLPLKLVDGLATEFFFLSSPNACCYGIVPEVNEWMLVKMRREGLPPIQDVPMFLAGRLQVRARWDEGYLIGIYDLDGEGLLKPRN